MMKRVNSLWLIVLAAIWVVYSCATTPDPQMLDSLRSAQTVHIFVTSRSNRYQPLPRVERLMIRKAQQSFEKVGIRSVDDHQAADLFLEIRGKWRAKGRHYSKGPVTRRVKSYSKLRKFPFWYTGASVVGSLYLKLGGRVVFSKYFNGQIPTALHTRGGSTNPSGAPFSKALAKPGSFEPKLAELIAEAFADRL